eukprot:Gregarina_sp_Pseudo_9__2729@NODE_2971_length_798_cov_40_231884_g2712_i0_p1_GENE_NODE_2971_length_798_cov_40_231884_g2712_i0NODE_2971_length_798_cov_40_231884_g2712_i0_p1_ORF_typecomplete_len132_score7_44Wzy_C/PF04932_15/0_00847TMRDISM_7TM/PF07695_11/0_01DUF3995/PF13160_6/0_017DUF2207/PF09972_9/0_065CcmH/PF03918_14/1e03CcmH/PF03918_14/0_1OST3_OST6/PF04756_13/0_16Orthoreo_P10/PF07204_11/0_492TM/PF13239_6/0_39Mid2/PF04478_12/1_9e02Mid2/PF04478_12/7_8Tetraspanin/PF00335_20/0_98FeoB_associated/PF1266
MPAFGNYPSPPVGVPNTESKLTEVWNVVKGFMAQPTQENAYVQAPGANLPNQRLPNDGRLDQTVNIGTIAISIIAAVLVIWLVKSLLPLLLWGGGVVLIAVAVLVCYHSARNQSRSQAFDAHPQLHDHYAV